MTLICRLSGKKVFLQLYRTICCFDFSLKVLDDGTLLKRYRKEISELKKQLVEVRVKLVQTFSYSLTQKKLLL